MKRIIAITLAIFYSTAVAAAPRAVEGAEPKADTRVHTILDADGHVAMRFLYPDESGPFNFVWTPKTGWRSIDEAKAALGHDKFAVVFCKDEVVRKIPAKCGGSLSALGGGFGGGTGFFSEYQSNFVGPPQADFIGPPVPSNNTWEGVIGGPGGPIPGGLPPVFDPIAARQSCINSCYAMWFGAGGGCALITATPVGVAACISAAGAGASGCPGSC